MPTSELTAAPVSERPAGASRSLGSRVTSPEPATLVLLAAVAAGVVGYGGYGPAGQPMVVLLAVAAVVALPALVGGVRTTTREVAVTALALAALGSWALLRAWLAGDATAGLPMLGLTGALVLSLLLLHLAGPAARDRTLRALLAIGALAALAGWVGVVWRVWPLVLADQGMWRAAGPIGYPNALAGLIVPLALLSLARLQLAAARSRQGRVADAAVAFLLVLGGLAALSRGGALGAAAGGLVLLALAGPRRVLGSSWPVLLGALVAGVGLLPSIREDYPANPSTAITALLAGLAVAVAGTVWQAERYGGGPPAAGVSEPGDSPAADARGRRGSLARVAVVAAGAIAALGPLTLVAAGPLRPSLAVVLDGRATLSSSWRVEQHVAAWRELADQPWLGTGPGLADLRWTTDDDRVLVARYVHDEYVQVATELGVVGAVLLLAVLAAVAAVLVAGRRAGGDARLTWAGAVAATVAFAVHSGFDFLWHIPVLPLVAVAVVAAVSRRPRSPATAGGADQPSRRSTSVGSGAVGCSA